MEGGREGRESVLNRNLYAGDEREVKDSVCLLLITCLCRFPKRGR